MPHSIVSNICEGIAVCVEACPVNCIYRAEGKNTKGTSYYFIEFQDCIDCGVCIEVCPVEGAVIAEENQEVQSI